MAGRQAKPKQGQRYKLTHPEGLGEGVGAVMPGTKVTIRQIVDAGTQGVGDHGDQEVVIVEWIEKGMVHDGQGNRKQGQVPRAVSIGINDFKSKFEAEEE